MIDIENELEDIVPTYDADVDLIQLLKDSTTLGTDDEGNQIPGYIFAKDLADMLEISENDMAMFAFENGYDIFNAVIDEEDTTAMEMLVICAKGFDHEVIKNDYEKIFNLKIELLPVESFDDSKLVEMKKTETTYSSKEIQYKIDSIVNKQIPDIEERIKKYETENASSKDDNRNRTLNNKIRNAETQLRELSKRKEKLEIDFKTAKENEDRKNREELEARIEKEISPGKGKRLKENPQIKITQEEKKSYDDFIDFLQDNTVSIRFDVASKREKFFRYLLPEIKDNQYNVISGKLESGQDKKWGISAVLTVKNVHLCPDSFRDYFTRGNKITENYKVIAILKTNFEVLEDKIKVSDSKEESLKEELEEFKPGTKIKLNKDTFYADIEVEGMFEDGMYEDDENLLDKFLNAGMILKGTELFIPAGSVLTFVVSLSVDVYDFNGIDIEVSEWPGEFDYTIINESVTEENELKNRAKKHKKTDRKSARGWFVNPSAGNVEQNIARANHMMGDGSVASSETVGSAPAGLGEEVIDEGPDMFGIETDKEIDKDADERKNKAYAKRKQIIDGDILTHLHNYSMLDSMIKWDTIEMRRKFLIDYLTRRITQVRKGPDSRGKVDFSYDSQYKDKSVDKATIEKMTDYIIDYYKDYPDFKKGLKSTELKTTESLVEMLPHEEESKTEFVSRFMSDDKMIKEYENPKQRYAVAMSYWEKK